MTPLSLLSSVLLLATDQPTPQQVNAQFWLSLVLGLFGLIGGGAGLAAVGRVRAQNKIDDSTADATAEDTRKAIMGMIQEGTLTLKAELTEARSKIAELELMVSTLRAQLNADAAAKRIDSLERDVLFWRARSESLQRVLDLDHRNIALPDRRNLDAGPPSGVEERRIDEA